MKDLAEFHNLLDKSSHPKRGAFGEYIFAAYLKKKGINFKSIHTNGVDFNVEGIGDIDLKTINHLNKSGQGKFRSYRYKLNGVSYFYLILSKESMHLYQEINEYQKLVATLNWNSYISILEIFQDKLTANNFNGPVSEDKKRIKKWISEEWGLRGKIITRSGKKTQDAFDRNGWGPNNFYTNDVPRKYDLVVLIYYDNSEIYKIYAYPIHLLNEIDWVLKDKGPNQQGIMIFDPRKLNEKFIFLNLTDFKVNFYSKFFKNHL